MVSSIQNPYLLTTSGTLPPSRDNHKRLQTLPNVPWGEHCAWLRTTALGLHFLSFGLSGVQMTFGYYGYLE